MITKDIGTSYGMCCTSAEINCTDNGQVVIYLTSTLEAGSPPTTVATYEHRITVGATDGKDMVSGMSETDLQTMIQAHLDAKRNEAAAVLAGRAKVAAIVQNLT